MTDGTPVGRRVDMYLLHYFLAVEEHGGFSRAADKLYLAQPSLSQAIRTLESRIGATLFDRSSHPIRLTPAGERFAIAARALLADVDDVRRAVDEVQELRSGRVDLVAHSAFAIEPLVELVRRFRTAHANILVNIFTAETAEGAKEMVRSGTAEIAIGYNGSDSGGLRERPLPPHEVVLVASPRLIDSGSGSIPRAAVADFPLVLDLGDRGARALLVQILGTNRDPRGVVHCAIPRLLWGLIARGTGATLTPRSVAEKYLPHSVRVSLHPPVYRTPALFTRTESLSAAASAFIDLAATAPTE